MPIWTENKAKLIERYLYYFVLITKHGTYIDGFAGPQNMDQRDGWAARLVLECEPRWLRHFLLCDVDKDQFAALERLRDEQPLRPKRQIVLYNEDFNEAVSKILARGSISEKEATFCLLDQRTFECKWATIEQLAKHKKQGQKIEIFYFLAAWWFDRAFTAQSDRSVLRRWWGRDDFENLRLMSNMARAQFVCQRLLEELGYRYATPWPIYERADGGHIAYYMIHASDHEEAPKLMSRAYRKAVTAKETPEQFRLEFGNEAVTGAN